MNNLWDWRRSHLFMTMGLKDHSAFQCYNITSSKGKWKHQKPSLYVGKNWIEKAPTRISWVEHLQLKSHVGQISRAEICLPQVLKNTLKGVYQFCQCDYRFGGGTVKAHFGQNISTVVSLEYLVLGKGCRWGGSGSWRDICTYNLMVSNTVVEKLSILIVMYRYIKQYFTIYNIIWGQYIC